MKVKGNKFEKYTSLKNIKTGFKNMVKGYQKERCINVLIEKTHYHKDINSSYET